MSVPYLFPEEPSSHGLDRNPEPPPELVEGHLLDADNIGSTVFSKRYVLSTLMKLIKVKSAGIYNLLSGSLHVNSHKCCNDYAVNWIFWNKLPKLLYFI